MVKLGLLSSLRKPALFYAAGVHFLITLSIVGMAAVLVFLVWYPYPFRVISGGDKLFILVTVVDVVIGPLITLLVFNPEKSRREKILDFSVIGVLQAAALSYGLWTVAQVRPVYIAFEYDRLRVVHVAEIAQEHISQAPEALQKLPLLGTQLLAVRRWRNEEEQFNISMAALAGEEAAFQPNLWQPYKSALPQIREVALPVADLLKKYPARAAEISLALGSRPPATTFYLPLHSRTVFFWTVLLDGDTLEPFAYMDIDPYGKAE